jgi:hypothetical protein
MGRRWDGTVEARICLASGQQASAQNIGGLTLRRLCRVLCYRLVRNHTLSFLLLTVWEYDAQLKEPSLPNCLRFAWDAAVPILELHHTLRVAFWSCHETEWVVFPPLLAKYVLVGFR